MKKHIKNLIEGAKNTVMNMLIQANAKKAVVAQKLNENSGQFVMDHAVVFIIIIVVAALAIALLTAYMSGDFATMIKSKVADLFN